MTTVTKPGIRDGIGADTRRPDGTLKVRGEFAYSSDLWSDRALWGTTKAPQRKRGKVMTWTFGNAPIACSGRLELT